jgi:hypothetical protein
MNTKILLILAAILIAIGLIKPDLSNLVPSNNVVPGVEIVEPSDASVKKECEDVIKILKNGDKKDAARLRDLYLDLSTLISLDGENEVIKTTEEIKQANSLAGLMLKLDIKDKYPDLAKEGKEVIVSVIGDDIVPLSPELRKQASEAFVSLAWACNEGAK